MGELDLILPVQHITVKERTLVGKSRVFVDLAKVLEQLLGESHVLCVQEVHVHFLVAVNEIKGRFKQFSVVREWAR